MNSFNTQLQIEDMYDQDDYAALLQYCEERSAEEHSHFLLGCLHLITAKHSPMASMHERRRPARPRATETKCRSLSRKMSWLLRHGLHTASTGLAHRFNRPLHVSHTAPARLANRFGAVSAALRRGLLASA